ncbi:MAG TPA: MBL fold metallo-hydrolase [Propionibacteriaceae bacterium]|nr:MBL fold metallo-hydrolase [Propionibacteriaceae bacterium]
MTCVRVVLASNPGPMTLEGTNTWVLGDPRVAAPVVVDPGPADEGHLQAVLASCGGRIAEIVLTHRHLDHSAGAPRLAALAGCGVRAAAADLCVGSAGLHPGDELVVAGAQLTAYPTPGHTRDSYSLLVSADDTVRLLTGDMVLGRGTTVIAHPDGQLATYLDSLTRLQDLVRLHRVSEILPGHGPRVESPEDWLEFYRVHRLQRLEQVRQALAAGDRTADEVVARVYADVDPSLWPAAQRSVLAQLEYLTTT